MGKTLYTFVYAWVYPGQGGNKEELVTIAHLSDTHLGYRAYTKTDPRGLNQREVDVVETFRSTLQAIAERDPDLVIHSGDFFDKVRPSNLVIVAAFKALLDFQCKRGNRPFVIVAGNHETPRVVDAGSILRLFQSIQGVHVFDRGSRDDNREVFDDLDAEVVAVPTLLLEMDENGRFQPPGTRTHNILVMHGMARGVIRDAGEFYVDQTEPDRWTYIALGDYHVHRTWGGNCCYAGSTDFTSTNIWEEVGTAKGWVWFDTDRGGLEFVPGTTRPVIDLPRIHAREMNAVEITDRALAQIAWDPDTRPIVRQIVTDVRPETRAAIDFATEPPSTSPHCGWRRSRHSTTSSKPFRCVRSTRLGREVRKSAASPSKRIGSNISGRRRLGLRSSGIEYGTLG